jgi:hypothetical protein
MINRAFYRIFVHNFRLKVMAVILAVVLWFLAKGKI